MNQLAEHLATKTGLKQTDVTKVLNELGLSQTLAEAEKKFGVKLSESVTPADLRVSVRLGRMFVAV